MLKIDFYVWNEVDSFSFYPMWQKTERQFMTDRFESMPYPWLLWHILLPP